MKGKKMAQKPVMLLILDGWGYRETVTDDNMIEIGNTPVWHKILAECPTCFVETSGLLVGLPEGQMGNSEVGHMNIGAGRVVMQDLPKINETIRKNELESIDVVKDLVAKLKANGKTCHIMGLLSPGGVHSQTDHIFALAKILDNNNISTKIHVITDGRDTPPTSGKGYVEEFEKSIEDLKNVKIATISGRFYAMDRDNRWDRVELAVDNMTLAMGEKFANPTEAMEKSYNKKINDEFILPCVIGDYTGFEDDDAILMANYRSDRAREITSALADKEFKGFVRKKEFKLCDAIGMTEYSSDHNRFLNVIFGPQTLTNIYGEIISKNGMKQLRIAETEKYAHVTFFFNGGEEAVYEGEERILIPSPKVATYDLKPEMSLYEVTENLTKAIESKKFDTIICNFANGDMVGHTGIMSAAIKAVEAVDECLGKTIEAIKKVGGVLIVTADHGNIEKMIDETSGEPYTAHTVGKVQAVLVNDNSGVKSLNNGKLADIAPTMLELLGVKQPIEMTGKSLINK